MSRIPKIIHYCWLGLDGEMPGRIMECVRSWKELMPDYEFILWDAGTFDIESVPWVAQACTARKWAFAADYIRLFALYHHGGIYVDSDVRTLKRFDNFLSHGGFSGIECWYNNKKPHSPPKVFIDPAVLGAEKGHTVIKSFLDYYDKRDFLVKGIPDTTTMPVILTKIAMRQYGYNKNVFENQQVLKDDFHVYPRDYFTAKTMVDHRNDPLITKNTVSIHLMAGSWVSQKRLHSPYTEWRLLTGKYFRELWSNSLSRVFGSK